MVLNYVYILHSINSTDKGSNSPVKKMIFRQNKYGKKNNTRERMLKSSNNLTVTTDAKEDLPSGARLYIAQVKKKLIGSYLTPLATETKVGGLWQSVLYLNSLFFPNILNLAFFILYWTTQVLFDKHRIILNLSDVHLPFFGELYLIYCYF